MLARALVNRNRSVALSAIKVLQRNSGQKSLLYQLDAHRPLLDALNYPDREVRFSAALAIGGALPSEGFEQAEAVGPSLAECLRQRGERYAIVIDGDLNRRNARMAALKESGQFAEVLGGNQFASVLTQMDRLPSFDLIVVAGDVSEPDVSGTVSLLKEHYRVAFCPTVVLADDMGDQERDHLAGLNSFVTVQPTDASVTEMLEAAWAVYESNQASPFSQEQADAYAAQAAEVLRMLALTENSVVGLGAAEGALIEALYDGREGIERASTDALGHIDSVAAQRALADRALDEGVPMEMRLLALQSLAVSAKKHGQLLASEQIDAFYEIVSSLDADVSLRNLAAEAYGALNLPSAKISQLILEQRAAK